MKKYLIELAHQLDEHNIQEIANINIIANDGEPAIIIVSDNGQIKHFIQNEDLTKLILIHSTIL